METMERDPAYIAEQVKFIRKLHGLTQENLADAAGLTTRTIEKIESGRHRPEEQTLRSIARALQIDVKYFEKLTPEQEARQKAEMERALRKMVLVPTNPIRSTSDFLSAFDQRHAFRIDTSTVTADEALETAAAMTDYITDLNDIWDDCPRSQQLEYARSFVDLCQQIEEHGYVCYMGSHRQRLRENGRPTLVFRVGVMTIQPKEGVDGTRCALIHLEGGWESLDADRVLRPSDSA
ncbi:MAG: XRE family transcriptional regulator [Mesorhizobium sp.]|uniref:helix-turn-helix domain-containing protein n=1 Tax=Mesorhizobium sp. TaxID=1871066 RepID=UPI000FE5FF8F|nr:helix-turn-helix transcriptional regulator [Mesorhizobium sp.]RWB70769.1 MAG: XRE family transcriptional regulator [Mesorhizobium sp.]